VPARGVGVGANRRATATSAGETEHGAAGSPDATALPLRISLLGGFVVSIGERAIPAEAWRLSRARSLIKLLALAPGHRLTRDQLVEYLWPDFPPETAITNLYSTLNAARQVLAPIAPLRLRGGVLTLDATGMLIVDVAAFTAAAVVAQRSGEPGDYTAAIALYSGELLPEDRYEDWAAMRREELRETYQRLLLALAARQRDAGEPSAAILTLQRLVADDSAHEEAHTELMRLHATLGQRAQAIRQYQALRAALERDLDAEPGPDARRLYGDIVTGQFPAAVAPPRPPMLGGASVVAGTTEVGSGAAQAPPSIGGRGGAATAVAEAHNLPSPLTSFLGREREVAEVRGLLERGSGNVERGINAGEEHGDTVVTDQIPRSAFPLPRLVTLIGIGGTGKTRLALAVARAVLGDYPGGVWFVDLAPLRDPALAGAAVATVIGVREGGEQPLLATLIGALRGKRLLLILDNCEHLIDAAAELAERLLSACPDLQVLATSREALRLAGEIAWAVPPLDLPPPLIGGGRTVTLGRLAETAAVRLFLDRVRQRQPQFALTADNAATVAANCRRLDGLPLALELAAARTAVLTIEQLAARLDDALGLLTTRDRALAARQQTLRATLDWSYGLLAPAEQQLLAWLAVFDGGGTLEAIEATAAVDSLVILDGLAVLGNQSLVQRHDAEGAVPRFRMLELVREYARERLVASGEIAAIRERHARYYLALAEQAEAGFVGTDQAAWQRRLAAEGDNLRAALRWTVEQRAGADGLRLASALVPFWTTQGAYGEGQAWLDALLPGVADDTEGAVVPPSVQAKALFGAAMLAWRRGDYGRMQDFVERALVRYRALNDPVGTAMSLRLLANIAMIGGQNDLAQAQLEEAQVLLRRSDAPMELARLLNTLGEVARSIRGDYALAERHYREALALERTVGTQEGPANVLGNLAAVVLRQGDPAEALRLYHESLTLRLALQHPRGIAICLEGFGAVSVALSRFGEAARFYGAAERLREVINSPRASDPADEVEHQHYLAIALERADPVAWTAAWAEGQALPLEQAIAAALALAGE
jgi:predicted ATPase/DNA-binding SARP family transcriptional activator